MSLKYTGLPIPALGSKNGFTNPLKHIPSTDGLVPTATAKDPVDVAAALAWVKVHPPLLFKKYIPPAVVSPAPPQTQRIGNVSWV